MKCTECGRPLHPLRPVCDFCGAEAPSSRVDALRWLVERARETGTSAAGRARILRKPGIPPRVSRRGLIAVGLSLAALLIALAVMTLGRGRSEPDTAASPTPDSGALRASIVEARTKEEALLTALDAAGQQIRELQAAQERSRAAADASTATAFGEITRLQEQVKTAQASAKTAQEAVDRATRRIQALTECLNGTTVALQFGRTDAWGPADRALAAVSAACADARALR